MSLDWKLRYQLLATVCLFTVTVVALDTSELELDTSLNPRLIGAVYHLYKPTTPEKVQPITIDCNHPSVICKFGTSALITENKECNCKDSSEGVPIISGLTTEDKVTNIKEKGGNEQPTKTVSSESKVPVYSGVIDTNAVLNEPDRPYTIWNFQRNSMDKGWRPSQDPEKTRIGELPSKFASYYPFSKPKLPNISDELPDFMPDFPDEPPPFFFWRKPGAFNGPKPMRPPSTNSNQRNPATKPVVKITTDKIATSSPASTVTPK